MNNHIQTDNQNKTKHPLHSRCNFFLISKFERGHAPVSARASNAHYCYIAFLFIYLPYLKTFIIIFGKYYLFNVKNY